MGKVKFVCDALFWKMLFTVMKIDSGCVVLSCDSRHLVESHYIEWPGWDLVAMVWLEHSTVVISGDKGIKVG